jgi:hypothetical protein
MVMGHVAPAVADDRRVAAVGIRDIGSWVHRAPDKKGRREEKTTAAAHRATI